MSTNYIYIICIVFLLVLVFLLGRKLYQFSILILKMESAIEDSLDILNERYSRLFEISQKPVFFDSVEVRQVIAEINSSHSAILTIANLLTNSSGIKSETKERKSISEEKRQD
jgi:predicted ABC-type exoprotein transport system permease subunit